MKTLNTFKKFFTPTLTLLLLALSLNAHSTNGTNGPQEPVEFLVPIEGRVLQIINDQSSELFIQEKICVVYVQTETQIFGIVEDYYSCSLALGLKEEPQTNVTLQSEFLYRLDSMDPRLNQLLLETNPGVLYLLYEQE